MSDTNPQSDRIDRIEAALHDVRYQATFIDASPVDTRRLFEAIGDADAAVRAVRRDVQRAWDRSLSLVEDLSAEIEQMR